MIPGRINMPWWTLIPLMGLLAALAAAFGARWTGTGGAVSFATMLLPSIGLALSGPVITAAAGCGIAVSAILTEAALGGWGDGTISLLPAVQLSAALLSVCIGAAALVRTRRTLPGSSRDGSPDPEESIGRPDDANVNGATISECLTPPATDAAESVRFPVMLETLEEIGRLVSMNRDVETLVPAMIETARASLKCGSCRVFLRDATRQTLVDPLAPAVPLEGSYVPLASHGIGAWVLRNRAVWKRDADCRDADVLADVSTSPWVPDAVAPLTAAGDVLGVLVVEQLQELTAHHEQMLYALANIYGLGIRNAQLFRRVEEMARRDGLTGLYNHTTFQDELRRIVHQSRDRQKPLSLVMSDIDHFKSFNDEFGHQVGDEVLREFARLWKAGLPESAVIARYGGEEFIAALPGVDRPAAIELAEFLRRAVEDHPFVAHGHQLQVTASFGIAELDVGRQTADDLVRIADRSLYAAKKAGRNVVASDGLAARFAHLDNR